MARNATVSYALLEVGEQIPALAVPPITRQTLAIYCGASGDHNPIHVDIDFAREAGLDDVIAHGMLVMAYMSRMLLRWVPQTSIQKFDTRFQAMTHVGDAITVTGHVVKKFTDGNDHCVQVALQAADQRGEVKTSGSAVLLIDAG